MTMGNDGYSQRDGHELLRAQPLREERRALARPAPRQQQRARRVLAELGGEDGRARQLEQQPLLELVGVGHEQRASGGSSPSAMVSTMPSSLHTACTS
jgi:hypothetical protein